MKKALSVRNEIQLHGGFHKETKWAKCKTARIKETQPMPCCKKLFVSKIYFFVEDMESSKLLHFENLKQYRDETNATIDTNYLSITVKQKEGLIRWEIWAVQNKRKYSGVQSKSSQHKDKWDQHWAIWNWCWFASNAISGFENQTFVEW